MFNKITKWRSKRYLKFVAEHPCCICGASDGTVVAHHFGADGKGIGSKVDDFYTVPLDFKCHDQAHRGSKIGQDSFPMVALSLVGEWLKLTSKGELE